MLSALFERHYTLTRSGRKEGKEMKRKKNEHSHKEQPKKERKETTGKLMDPKLDRHLASCLFRRRMFFPLLFSKTRSYLRG